MSETRVLSGGAATLAIARVAWIRMVRGRALWGAALLASLSLVMAILLRGFHAEDTGALIEIGHATAAILTGLLVAAPIGEEFEDRTMTYLWSRPLPRWSVVTGKLVALTPVAAALAAATLVAALAVAGDPRPVTGVAAATALGVGARAAIGAAMATLVPRHALALTVAYLLFLDGPIAAIPARVQLVSVWFHEAAASGAGGESVIAGYVGLVVIAGLWLAVALWRVRRIE